MRDRAAAERWIRAHVQPVGPVRVVHERPWSTVLRVPLRQGAAWFKACMPMQAFEPHLSVELFARWRDLVGEIIAHDEGRAWLLLADAGEPIGVFGNPPEAWLDVLPRYAELQRGETAHAHDHIAHGVPSLPIAALPGRFAELLARDLRLDPREQARLRAFAPRFERLCADLASGGVAPTVQHDDLHMGNVYDLSGRRRILDWGDSSISHPFFSLIATFRFLEERAGLQPGDRWFARLSDAYLEPWGASARNEFDAALRVGAFAHAIAKARQQDFLAGPDRSMLDEDLAQVLRLALRLV
jgi:hypothetical protein